MFLVLATECPFFSGLLGLGPRDVLRAPLTAAMCRLFVMACSLELAESQLLLCEPCRSICYMPPSSRINGCLGRYRKAVLCHACQRDFLSMCACSAKAGWSTGKISRKNRITCR